MVLVHHPSLILAPVAFRNQTPALRWFFLETEPREQKTVMGDLKHVEFTPVPSCRSSSLFVVEQNTIFRDWRSTRSRKWVIGLNGKGFTCDTAVIRSVDFGVEYSFPFEFPTKHDPQRIVIPSVFRDALTASSKRQQRSVAQRPKTFQRLILQFQTRGVLVDSINILRGSKTMKEYHNLFDEPTDDETDGTDETASETDETNTEFNSDDEKGEMKVVEDTGADGALERQDDRDEDGDGGAMDMDHNEREAAQTLASMCDGP